MGPERVYLDHNSTTTLRPDVRELWLECIDADLGNASGTHAAGRRARAVVDDARERVAAAVGIPEEWVVFTSGGTEANNHALRGVFEHAPASASLAISAVEHSSVLETALGLQARGRTLHQVHVDARGSITLDSLRETLLQPDLRLLSVMTANNESGALNPMASIADMLAELDPLQRPLWHTDAVQALGKVPLRLKEWGVDLASFSAHKLGGPQGVGFLVRRPSAALAPLLLGGGQEAGARSGTENVAGIAACALAVELAVAEQMQFAERVQALSKDLWEQLHQRVPSTTLLGPALDEPRLPNTLNILFDNLDGRTLVARLDLEGLEASLGSACSSGAIEPSHVLLAMGLSAAEARAGLRLSLGRATSHKDIHSAVDILGKVLQVVKPPA